MVSKNKHPAKAKIPASLLTEIGSPFFYFKTLAELAYTW
jgi:hypothetical protein